MPEVSNSTLELIYQDIVNSVGYRTTVGPTDKGKVSRRYAGQKTELPSSRLGRAAWRVAAVLKPIVPPPTYKKVAPRVAYKEGGSDARFCVHNQPGVTWNPETGRWHDEVATYDGNGLSWGGRSDGPAVTGAKQMDRREPCELPTMGEPEKNTGSWAI